jgi:xanthine dehydrogenase large subunit
MTHHKPNLRAETIKGGVATDQRHDSAHKHVTGTAVYIDDMPEPAGTLHACLGLAEVPHGRIRSMNLDAVHKPRPASSTCSLPRICRAPTTSRRPASHDEPVLADGKVQFHGQPVFA